jgi:hypothetical protein
MVWLCCIAWREKPASAIFFQPEVLFFQAGAVTCWSAGMASGTVGAGIEGLLETRLRVLGPPTGEIGDVFERAVSGSISSSTSSMLAGNSD